LFSDLNVAIGKVLSAHGIAGLVKVMPFTDNPDRINNLEQVELLSGETQRRVEVIDVSVHGRFWLVKLQGIENRDEASKISGSFLVIPKNERAVLPEGSYYFDQLIDLTVQSVSGEYIGIIVEVISRGGHDQYLVKRTESNGKELLIPAVRQFVKKVDLAAGKMIVDLPEGLLEI